jgi:hypothetical protein
MTYPIPAHASFSGQRANSRHYRLPITERHPSADITSVSSRILIVYRFTRCETASRSCDLSEYTP